MEEEKYNKTSPKDFRASETRSVSSALARPSSGRRRLYSCVQPTASRVTGHRGLVDDCIKSRQKSHWEPPLCRVASSHRVANVPFVRKETKFPACMRLFQPEESLAYVALS
jgi:hypothetical protein